MSSPSDKSNSIPAAPAAPLEIPADTNSSTNSNLKNPVSNPEEIPLEYQLHTVDLNDPMMDPLEYAVRKYIPIPKAYFWETGNLEVPTKIKVWHRTISALEKTVQGVERAGSFVARGTGMDGWSRYSYVLDTMTEEEKQAAIQIERERRSKSKIQNVNVSAKKDKDDDIEAAVAVDGKK